MRIHPVLPAAALLGLLAACDSTLKVSITDAPPLTSATRVWLQFSGMEIKPLGGKAKSFEFSPPKGFDLLTLREGNVATLLDDTTVDAGSYEWIRLTMDSTAGSSYVVDATGTHALTIPSGAESGLKIIRAFTLPADGRADLTIDFVLHKSIIAASGQSTDLVLNPVLRLVDNLEAGIIAGAFTSSTFASVCNGKAPVIYLYTGANVTPDDIYNPLDGSADTNPAVDPLVTATTASNSSAQYAYHIAFVPEGTYTVAFTCDSDDPAVDENVAPAVPLQFVTYSQAVTVTAGQTTTVNF